MYCTLPGGLYVLYVAWWSICTVRLPGGLYVLYIGWWSICTVHWLMVYKWLMEPFQAVRASQGKLSTRNLNCLFLL